MSAISLGPDPQRSAQDTADSVELLSNGVRISADWSSMVVDVQVRDFWTQPDVAVVRFHDPTGDKLTSSPLKLGGTLVIKFGSMRDRTSTKIFEGDVVALEPEFLEDGLSIAVRAFDKGHRLNRTKRSEVYLDKTASDIVKAAVARNGLTAGTIDATSSVFPHFQQSMETDWEMCWRLARMNGYEFGVDDNKAYFRKRASSGPAATLTYRQNLLKFAPRVSAVGQVSQVTINSNDPKAKAATVGTASSASPGGGAPSIVTTRAKAIADLGGGVALVADRVATSTGEANKMAEGALARNAAAFLEAEGTCLGSPLLVAGATVKVAGVGTDYSGNYVLSSTHHIFRGGHGYTTRFEITGDRPRTFAQLIGGGGATGGGSGGGGAAGDRSAWASQLVIAQVSNSNDPEDMGRVKVKFDALGSDIESEWARVTTMGAGNGRGVFMMPQAGDSVVVGFEHGDPRRPFVLGTLYAGKKSLPPELKASGREPMFAVKTPHQVYAQSDKELKLSSNEKMTIEVKGNPGDLGVTADGEMKLSGKKNIKSDAAQNFEVSANSSVKIKGSGTVEIESSGQLKVKGSTVSIEGSGMVEVKGGMIKLG